MRPAAPTLSVRNLAKRYGDTPVFAQRRRFDVARG